MSLVHIHDGRTVELAPRGGLIRSGNEADPWTGQAYELFFLLVLARESREDPLVRNEDLAGFKNLDNLISLIQKRLAPNGGHKYVLSLKGRGRVFNPWSATGLGRVTAYLEGSWRGIGWHVAAWDPGAHDVRVTEASRALLCQIALNARSTRFDYEMDLRARGSHNLVGEGRVRTVIIRPDGVDEVLWTWDRYVIEMWPDREERPRLTARFTSEESQRWSDDGAGTLTLEDSDGGGSRFLMGLLAANQLPLRDSAPCDLRGVDLIRIRFDKVTSPPA